MRILVPLHRYPGSAVHICSRRGALPLCVRRAAPRRHGDGSSDVGGFTVLRDDMTPRGFQVEQFDSAGYPADVCARCRVSADAIQADYVAIFGTAAEACR